MENNNNTPKINMSAGAIKATVWNNKTKQDGQDTEYSTITIERVYKDKEGNWQKTNILRVNDLPKAKLLLDRIYEKLIIGE